MVDRSHRRLIGILASALQRLGNPPWMGICVASFKRDIAGALGLHRADCVVGAVPTLWVKGKGSRSVFPGRGLRPLPSSFGQAALIRSLAQRAHTYRLFSFTYTKRAISTSAGYHLPPSLPSGLRTPSRWSKAATFWQSSEKR